MTDISMTSEDHILHVIGGETKANQEPVVPTAPVVPLLRKVTMRVLVIVPFLLLLSVDVKFALNYAYNHMFNYILNLTY